MILYSYWRSTTAFRVRVVLNMLDLNHQIRPVNLALGEHLLPSYAALNPGQSVPVLELDCGTRLSQSMAIIDYLLARHGARGLIPDDPLLAARMRSAVDTIAMDIHPLNNLRVLGRLGQLGHSPAEIRDWMRHWMDKGLSAFQARLAPQQPFSFGPTPTLADVCLSGQMINARRWGLDLAPLARLIDIDTRCRALPAFAAALPENQPDAEQD